MADPQMAEASYSYRPHVLSAKRLYRLEPDRLVWSTDRRHGHVAYSDVEQMRVFKARFLGSATTYWNCVLLPRSGGKIRLGAADRVGLRAVEDRSDSYFPFVRELEARVAAANPQLRVVAGQTWLNRLEAIGGWIVVVLIRIVRRLDRERTARAAGWLLRKVGPWLRGHRTAAQQLALAYPGKPPAEVEKILSGMWDNLGRVAAEYAHLDRIWDLDIDRSEQGQIVADAATIEHCRQVRNRQGPVLLFGAHIGNWEVSALGANVYAPDVTVIYKAPRIAAVADELIKLRRSSGALLYSADPTTALKIKDSLKRGHVVGMLIDQHYADGVEVTMFNRACRINPLFARFVRIFDCEFRGFYIERQPDGRFRLYLTEAIEPRRDATGRVDVAGTTQVIISTVEGWVRLHPEQWMWLQRRWR